MQWKRFWPRFAQRDKPKVEQPRRGAEWGPCIWPNIGTNERVSSALTSPPLVSIKQKTSQYRRDSRTSPHRIGELPWRQLHCCEGNANGSVLESCWQGTTWHQTHYHGTLNHIYPWMGDIGPNESIKAPTCVCRRFSSTSSRRRPVVLSLTLLQKQRNN